MAKQQYRFFNDYLIYDFILKKIRQLFLYKTKNKSLISNNIKIDLIISSLKKINLFISKSKNRFININVKKRLLVPNLVMLYFRNIQRK